MTPSNRINCDENEDLMILTKQFELLKVMEDAERLLADGNASTNCVTPNGFKVDPLSSSISFSSSSSSTATSNDDYSRNKKEIEPSNAVGTGDGTSALQRIKQFTKPFLVSPVRTIHSVPFLAPSFEVGRLINKDMLKFDPTERNAITEEVHGVTHLCIDESKPGLVENALIDLDSELSALPAQEKTAYLRSFHYPESYIHQRDFKLRFLRAELFDARNAAMRLALCLENFLDIFGEYALIRPILLSDFSTKELKAFAAGRIQLMPFRDRGGRRVIVGFPSRDHHVYDAITRVKIHMYLWWVATECEETQRKGIVFITFQAETISDTLVSTTSKSNNDDNVSQKIVDDVDYQDRVEKNLQHAQQGSDSNTTLVSLDFAKYYSSRKGGLPGRLVSIHMCTPDTPYFAVLRTFVVAMLGIDRCRLRIHVGNDTENRYCLSGFGIPHDQLPITDTGNIKINYLKKWFKLRRKIEDADNYSPSRELGISWNTIECPLSNDVLFRPSQSMMCHPGNVMFRGLVESKHLAHSLAPTRDAKVEITKSVRRHVQNLGGRFLVWDSVNWWTELTDEKQIYMKIAVFFRNSKISARANVSSTESSTYIFADRIHSDDTITMKRRKMGELCFCSL